MIKCEGSDGELDIIAFPPADTPNVTYGGLLQEGEKILRILGSSCVLAVQHHNIGWSRLTCLANGAPGNLDRPPFPVGGSSLVPEQALAAIRARAAAYWSRRDENMKLKGATNPLTNSGIN